ncbi:zinc finger protein VAR3, chloroplastic [Punica granatum]|uniref:Zinc finger protein VAR3, chloroplastic n=2 Tax=Punica granatum TaxID=22663 RepID=A0A6P8DE19_PUNGR|nr:zinc finger protein VAR3, chloroplastic [Punica granatum]PKI58899.1 hypothetical protein CRG98_020645 [Punica granatum]
MGGATRFLMLLATPFPPRTPSLLRLARRHHHYRHCPSITSFSAPRVLSGSSHRIESFRVKSSSSQQLHAQASTFRDDPFADSAPPVTPEAHHPWPEWLHLIGNLSVGGYVRVGSSALAPEIGFEDEYAAGVDLPEEFLSAARACLAFARDRPQLIPALPRNDIEIVVNNGTPFLFKNADDSIRRMRSFLISSEGMVADSDKAQTVDLMRFILSYASNPVIQDAASFSNQELVASSVRNLIKELVKLSSTSSGPKFTEPVQNQFAGRYGQAPRSRGQNIEMKRGDWICPRCNFMNFARNMKCLECEEARPKRQLAGGEWECPQCDFLNHGRNTACLRCDCKHPGGLSPIGSGYGAGSSADRADLESRLAANEEKAQRWFSKVSQLNSTSDISSAIADEDFPEIMPLRKGVNRFVVSTRKTPLERRLANAQYSRNSSNGGTLTTGDANKTEDSSISRRPDDVMGRKSEDKMSADVGNNIARDNTPPYPNSPPPQQGYPRGNNSSYVPFVPLPADMFAKKPENSAADARKTTEERSISLGSNTIGQTSADANSPSNISGEKDREREEKSEGWFKRITELHDSQDLTAAISNEDFPEAMPMRKGESRFVISKKKDRSLTSPLYKRRAAMEQASNSNSNYVPFVPFPPDYFAKKENQQSNVENTIDKSAHEYLSPSTRPQEQKIEIPQVSSGNWDMQSSIENAPNREAGIENSTQEFGDSQASSNVSIVNETTNTATSSTQQSRSYSWSGKSLEGSAVKEPDPLDMSEEAKAERWFRRVAQIKDISELSQIPDEDFPSIMPMRKGVNRFVVSKRKTPLERRLTSAQYRRNLPVVSSDPIKKDTDSNGN